MKSNTRLKEIKIRILWGDSMFKKFKKKIANEVLEEVLDDLLFVILDHNQTIEIKKEVGTLDNYEVGIGSGLRMARGRVSAISDKYK